MRTGVESFWLRRILEKEEEKEDISKIKLKDQKTETLNYAFGRRRWILVSMEGHGRWKIK